MPVLNYAQKHEGTWGSKISFPSILTWTGTTMTTQLYKTAALSRENSTAIHSTGGQVDHRIDADVDTAWRKKYLVSAGNRIQVPQSFSTQSSHYTESCIRRKTFDTWKAKGMLHFLPNECARFWSTVNEMSHTKTVIQSRSIWWVKRPVEW